MGSRQKQVGRRKIWDASAGQRPDVLSEADQWLKTVQRLRRLRGVCKKGLYKFRTFEEADRWMEMMILSSTRGFQPFVEREKHEA